MCVAMSRPSPTHVRPDPASEESSSARTARRTAFRLVVAALATIAAACGPTACKEAPRRPNVLIYVIDTLRADALTAYGNAEANTPNLDALAREGLLFEHAYANASWTRASVATLLTGLLPWHHGAESRPDRLPEAARTVSEIFAEQGYATAIVSANPNVSRVFGFQQAFDEFGELFARKKPGLVLGRELVTPSDVVTRDAVGWLREARQPFFLVVLSIDPHHPYQPPPRHDPGRHRADPEADAGVAGENPAGRARTRELYQGEVAFNDESFGRLEAAMKQLGVWDDTIVVVTADHGEEFWEYDARGHGKTLREEVLRIPLIIRPVRDTGHAPGTRLERRIALVDLFPTLLGLAGIPPPADLDGADYFAGPELAAPPALAGLDLDGRRLLAAIDAPYKLVWDLEADRRVLYDLRGEHPEATPVDPASSPEARRAFDALTASLAASLSRTERALGKSGAGELPEHVEQSLRALGYID